MNDEDAREKAKQDGVSVDWHFQSLISLANNNALGISVTLSVGGSIVTGTLIGGAEYFQLFSEQISSNIADEEAKRTVRESYAQLGEIYAQNLEITEGENGDSATEERPLDYLGPQYVHLKDAQIISTSGQTLPSNEGALWRFKVNTVDGFSLGRLVRQ